MLFNFFPFCFVMLSVIGIMVVCKFVSPVILINKVGLSVIIIVFIMVLSCADNNKLNENN